MRPPAFLALALLAAVALIPRVEAATLLSVDLSEPVIEITTGFSGTDVLLFGAIEGSGDVVIVISGPLRSEIVRRKVRIAGIWINAESRRFETVPAYYHVASTRQLTEIAPEKLLRKFQIGPERIAFGFAPGQSQEDRKAFHEALIRNKKHQGLYGALFNRIGVSDGRLFRANFTFPANVPTGTYNVDVYLLRKGKIIGTKSRTLAITKVGLEASIFNFAHQEAPLYGIMAIMIALIAGWLAGVIFRKA